MQPSGDHIAADIASGQHGNIRPEAEQYGEWYTKPDWWVAIFTAALFMATTGLWVVTYYLWRSTRQAVRDEQAALKVAQDNAKAARDGANAAFKQTEHLAAQTTAMKAMQRAFIAVDSIGIENIWGNPIIARTRFTNTGNIPAQNVRWIVYSEIDKDPRRRRFDVRREEIQISNNIIAPNHPMVHFTNLTEECGITPNKIQWVRTTEVVLYIWGIVLYFDGISPDERWTCFCHRYEADCIRNGIDDITDDRVRQHQFGNGTDEDEPGGS